jgi:N-acetylmuramoyl-L-alanine amidase
VLKFRKAITLALLIGGFAGCQTPPAPQPAQPRVTPLVDDQVAPSITLEPPKPEPEPEPLPETNAVPVSLPVPVVTLKPSPAVVPTNALNRWISWEAWSLTNGFGKPQRLPNASNLSYQLKGGNTSLAITIGSPVARWNGVSLELAFVPKFTNGQPFIHALDAMKNFDPLVMMDPLFTKTNRTLVIDPGHGGVNTGARCVCNSSFEKHYTLDWALRLRPLLEARGWTVHLTRTNDTDLSLSNRVTIADHAQADLFLSLHFNSSNSGVSRRNEHGGLETYCLTPAGMPSTFTREFDDPRFRIYPNNAYDAENLQYAVRLHRALVEATSGRDRGVRRARFMTVLQGQNRPAVLIEGGYLSDPKEARLIATASYRQKLAEAVAKALEH